MVISFGTKKSDKKILYKRINRQLVANFFTVEEFKTLSLRQGYKVIKLIAKYEGIKLSKTEIKEIVNFIQSDFTITKENITHTASLWSFVIDYLQETTTQERNEVTVEEQEFIKYYRFHKFDLLRL